MFNDTNAFANLLTGPGLYRVWIRANEAKSAPLVSIWIDPEMRVFEPQMKAESNLPLASIPASGRPDGQPPRNRRQRRKMVQAVAGARSGHTGFCRGNSPLGVFDPTCVVTNGWEDHRYGLRSETTTDQIIQDNYSL